MVDTLKKAPHKKQLASCHRELSSFRAIALFLLTYFSLCAGLYDPVVLVDDSPREPIFKGIIGAGQLSILSPNHRYKVKRLTHEQDPLAFLATNGAKPHTLRNSFTLECLTAKIVVQKQTFFTQSMPIRAPAA